jgi:hypothetical protein
MKFKLILLTFSLIILSSCSSVSPYSAIAGNLVYFNYSNNTIYYEGDLFISGNVYTNGSLVSDSENPIFTNYSYNNLGLLNRSQDTFLDYLVITSINYDNNSLISNVVVNNTKTGVQNLAYFYENGVLSSVEYN